MRLFPLKVQQSTKCLKKSIFIKKDMISKFTEIDFIKFPLNFN